MTHKSMEEIPPKKISKIDRQGNHAIVKEYHLQTFHSKIRPWLKKVAMKYIFILIVNKGTQNSSISEYFHKD